MASINDLRTEASRIVGNMCFVSGLVDNATNAGLIKTVTNTIVYTVDGKLASYAPTDNIAFAVPTAAQLPYDYQRWISYDLGTAVSATVKFAPAGCTFYSVYAFDSAGTVTCFQGDYAGQDLTFRGMPLQKGTGLIPQIPPGFTPFVIVKIVHTAAAVFVHGATTALTDAGSRTVTFTNVSVMPSTTTL